MHEIEPYYQWREIYIASEDPNSPFYGKLNNEVYFEDTIYSFYIHPQWDYIGSETLYIKILYVNYDTGSAIIELFGEWNDAIHNDIMHLKRNVIDELIPQGINKFILIGENVLNFHGSDDCYYEEWFDDVEEGWLFAIGFQEHVVQEWKSFNIDAYIDYSGNLDLPNWRTFTPDKLILGVDKLVSERLGL